MRSKRQKPLTDKAKRKKKHGHNVFEPVDSMETYKKKQAKKSPLYRKFD